jgi:hypothetical protein
MSKKFLGRMVAGAALAGACLLSTAPGAAAATPADGGGDHYQKGIIKTFPQWVKPGYEVKVVQICKEPQQKAWAWSEPTGKVKLWPWKGGPPPTEVLENNVAPSDGAYPDGKKYDMRELDSGDAQKDGVGGNSFGHKDGNKKHFVYWAKAKIPSITDPGHYKLKGSCAYGHLYVVPDGAVDGGDGGTSDTNTSLAVGGAGALAVAGVGGIMMMRRRKTDGSIA